MSHNMKKLEMLIPAALEAVSAHLETKKKSNKVPKEYFGYAAQLGASIRTAGLLPALAFYTDKHKDKKDNEPQRLKLLKAIIQILNENHNLQIGDGLLEYAVEHKDDQQQLKQKILDASVALKLALRNFEKVETK